MGAYSHLSIGKLDLDWGKNDAFPNHSNLYLPTDKTTATYYYANDIEERKKCYARRLGNMIPRLELLGFTLKKIESSFKEFKIDYADNSSKINNISFEDYYRALSEIDLNTASPGQDHYPEDFYMRDDSGELLVTLAFQFEDFNKLIPLKDDKHGSEFKYSFLSQLYCYNHLRILAENPNNHDCLVEWKYADIVEEGYAKEEDIYYNFTSQTLIVTEGSTDSSVIKKSFELLRPYIKDFFYFVDMEKEYPFSGVGNLVNFIKGLSAIKVSNNILAIFDNDAVGCQSYDECKKLSVPDNIKLMKLPELSVFDKFTCIGPTGETIENINKKAVAIECFLDFESISNDPKIRWKNYVDDKYGYQGVLEKKREYLKKFETLNTDNYDFSKITVLIDDIIKNCVN